MVIQTKGNADNKICRKKGINWTQVGVVAFCVVLVMMCILSFSNFDNIFKQHDEPTTGAIGEGRFVTVGCTMYINNTPMVTSSTDVYNASPVDKRPALIDTFLVVAGRMVENEILIPIKSLNKQLFLLPEEFNQISTGVVSLGIGESTTVKSRVFPRNYTKDQVIEKGIDYANLTVGKMVNLPEVSATSNITEVIRPVLVVSKTADEVVFQYGYDTIEIQAKAAL